MSKSNGNGHTNDEKKENVQTPSGEILFNQFDLNNEFMDIEYYPAIELMKKARRENRYKFVLEMRLYQQFIIFLLVFFGFLSLYLTLR